MANLKTVNVTGNSYIDIFNYANLVPVENKTYQIQILNNAYLREGAIGDGIYVNTTNTIDFTYKGDTLYIKPSAFSCIVNISN